MPDIPEGRRRIMRAIRSKDTGPELALRGLLHRSGYRFRLHRRDLPGTPDIVFPSRRAAILMHGCFWHQHRGCPHANIPTTRKCYWLPKLARNKERDLDTAARLEAAGWRHLVIWECELIDPSAVLSKAGAFLGPPGAAMLCSPILGAQREHSPRGGTDRSKNASRGRRAPGEIGGETDA